ncbi:MAG TPA: patatin-like phospholipase family protein [Aequorivita sp.]|nr:patatin-like phospholipase family protein [Aequorivita sp.]
MNRYIAFLTLIFVVLQLNVNAQVAENNAFKGLPDKKPKVALVLSGGGAKGVAHIPTLQTLDSLGIVPDLIVGNSMGSIMGGLYAMGYSGDSIVNLVKQTNWENLMGGGVFLRNVGAEEKAEFGQYFIEMDWTNGGLKLGKFLVNDQSLREFITILTFPAYDVNEFDDLPIPFRAVATDIVNGKEVVLNKGSLALAMRASMSIPGVFQAVAYEETLLIDGGLLNNFPVDVAKELGADFIIGSDVGDEPFTKKSLEYLPSLMSQTTMLNSNIKRPGNRAMCDILISHSGKLTYSTADFNKTNVLYEEGKIAVKENMDALVVLSNQLKNYEQRKVELLPEKEKFVLDTIIYTGISKSNLALVKARANLKVNQSYSIEDAIDGINKAMGTTLFEQMAYNSVVNDTMVGLELIGVERSPHQVKGGLHYDRYNGIGILANYTGRNLLGDASRTVVTLDIAEQPKMRIQYQKNFGYKRNWWWRAELYGQQLKQKIYFQGEYVENMRNRYHAFDNQFNRNLSPLRSYVGVGLKYHNTNIKPTIKSKVVENIFKLSSYNNYDIELYAQYNYNSLNQVLFATQGALLKGFIGRSLYSELKVNYSDENIPDYNSTTNNFTRLGIDYEKRFPIANKVTTIVGASGHVILQDAKNSNEYSNLALNSKYFLGGNVLAPRNEYFNFPGLEEEELPVNQFVKFNLGLQYNAFDNIFITPHIDVASIGFGDFTDYIDDAFAPRGKWVDFEEPSLLLSAGATISYKSLLGPVNFDVSWVNNTDKLRFFIGIGFHMNRSN